MCLTQPVPQAHCSSQQAEQSHTPRNTQTRRGDAALMDFGGYRGVSSPQVLPGSPYLSILLRLCLLLSL